MLLCGTEKEPQKRIDKIRLDTTNKLDSNKDNSTFKTVESVDKTLINEILKNLPPNSKIRKKIIEKYGGNLND